MIDIFSEAKLTYLLDQRLESFGKQFPHAVDFTVQQHRFSLSAQKCQHHTATTNKFLVPQCKEQLEVLLKLLLEQFNQSWWSNLPNINVCFIQISSV